VKTAEMQLADTTIRVPFDGLIVDRMIEIGDFVEAGDAIARLIDLDPLLVVAQLSERDAGRLAIGGLAQARLITGQEIDGVVSYISAEADPATRTFRVEVEVANLDGALADGISAEVTLPLGQVVAHRVSPAVLTLSDAGEVGVRTLAPDNTVTFQPVRILGEESAGVWIAGLPQRVTLITVGQEFISDGQTVRPIDEQTLAPFAPETATGGSKGASQGGAT
jgi:multidrug efflux system membrane fusion protein